jgi:uncharacterized membrane protein YfcA
LIQLPDSATFAATLSDGHFAAAAAIALLAGVVRGFSGFGSALIYVPLIAAVYEPRIATVSYALMDVICIAPLALRALRQCHWREVIPAIAVSFFTVPLGTMMQNALDPVILRWIMAGFVFAFVALLTSGWRYPWPPSALAAGAVGALSGFAGGAVQMAGPPAILYWLGSPSGARIVRANLMAFLFPLGLNLLVSYGWHGLMTAKPIALAVLLWPVYILALFVGVRAFHGATEATYRRIAYAIVMLAALVSLPLFDRVLHW